jgi:hypothetical protein
MPRPAPVTMMDLPSSDFVLAMMFLCPVFPRLKQTPLVMRGLDPRIHPFSQDDGLPGQARQ